MQRELLEKYIYNEVLLANIYKKLASMGSNAKERSAFLAFAARASNNAAQLNNVYRDEYGVNFNPIVPDTVLQGGYRELLNEVLEIEISTMTDLRNQTYFQSNYQWNELFRKIADDKMVHIIQIIVIITYLNSQEIESLNNKA